MIAARPLVTGLALLLIAAGSCRRHDLCEGAECAEGPLSGASGTASGGRPTLSSGGVAASVAGDGGSESLPGAESLSGAAGDSGAAGEAGIAPLQCDTGTGDCDYSRLTGCETHLSWAVRHCGSCGVSCEDGCSAGKCLQSTLLKIDFEGYSFVSTRTFAFAILSNLDGTDSFFRVRIDTGATDELLGSIGDSTEVVLGDRVYLFDPDSTQLRSTMLDGTDPHVEELTAPRSMGAYPGGAYYIGSMSDSEGNDRSPLYYRPHADSPWQELKADVDGRIWSSSDYGVVYGETTGEDFEDEVHQLYLLRDDQLIPYGLAPQGTHEALATGEGITVLTYDYDTSVPELWWLTLDSMPTHYALPVQSSAPRMRPYRDGVALSLVEGKSAYVQVFGKGGPDPGKIGVRLGSSLLGLDDRYLWHLVTDDWFHWRFLQTDLNLFGF